MSLPEPARLPVVDWLGRALDRGRQTPTASLVDTIDRVQHQLAWRYGYDRVPRSLQGKYAFAELMGPKGPVVSERLILGLVLLAPGCTYPSHAHDGITESYICLSGTLSGTDYTGGTGTDRRNSCEDPGSAGSYLDAGTCPFSLLADPAFEASEVFCVFQKFSWGAVNVARPASFIIDRCGFLRYCHTGSSPLDAAPLDELLGSLRSLRDEEDRTGSTGDDQEDSSPPASSSSRE